MVTHTPSVQGRLLLLPLLLACKASQKGCHELRLRRLQDLAEKALWGPLGTKIRPERRLRRAGAAPAAGSVRRTRRVHGAYMVMRTSGSGQAGTRPNPHTSQILTLN